MHTCAGSSSSSACACAPPYQHQRGQLRCVIQAELTTLQPPDARRGRGVHASAVRVARKASQAAGDLSAAASIVIAVGTRVTKLTRPLPCDRRVTAADIKLERSSRVGRRHVGDHQAAAARRVMHSHTPRWVLQGCTRERGGQGGRGGEGRCHRQGWAVVHHPGVPQAPTTDPLSFCPHVHSGLCTLACAHWLSSSASSGHSPQHAADTPGGLQSSR
jgi:hypothetical protein